MKTGDNLLLKIIDSRIDEKRSQGGIFTATVLKTSPMTIQPDALTPDGKKQRPIVGCRYLDLGYKREYKVGDSVVAAIPTDSLEHFGSGKGFVKDATRTFSIDSSIVMGVLG